jgi:hypothetical protein
LPAANVQQLFPQSGALRQCEDVKTLRVWFADGLYYLTGVRRQIVGNASRTGAEDYVLAAVDFVYGRNPFRA